MQRVLRLGALNARAFTSGHHIYFGQGEYQPETGPGRELIAHELTHVVQQRTGRVSRPAAKPAVDRPGDPLEHEADGAASDVVQGRTPSASAATGGRVRRKVSASKCEDVPGMIDLDAFQPLIVPAEKGGELVPAKKEYEAAVKDCRPTTFARFDRPGAQTLRNIWNRKSGSIMGAEVGKLANGLKNFVGAAQFIVELDINEDHTVTLRPTFQKLKTTFPYLNEAVFNVTIHDDGCSGSGEFHPSLPLLKRTEFVMQIETGVFSGALTASASQVDIPIPGVVVAECGIKAAIQEAEFSAEGVQTPLSGGYEFSFHPFYGRFHCDSMEGLLAAHSIAQRSLS